MLAFFFAARIVRTSFAPVFRQREIMQTAEVTYSGLLKVGRVTRDRPCRVAEGIVGHADLTLGARVRDVLEAEIRVE
jgi:hypothetical protein